MYLLVEAKAEGVADREKALLSFGISPASEDHTMWTE
jgi:hypothetical protein